MASVPARPCLEDRARDQAEAEIARLYPVLFAVWDTVEAGEVSPGLLAARLGVSRARVRLLATVADWLITQTEREVAWAMGP